MNIDSASVKVNYGLKIEVLRKRSSRSLLRRGFNTEKIEVREASARFLTQYGPNRGGGDTNYIGRIQYRKRHMTPCI